MEIAACLLHPLAHAPLLLEERVPYPPHRGLQFFALTLLLQEFPARPLEHRRCGPTVRDGVDDDPFIDRGPCRTPHVGVGRRTGGGENPSVIDPWCDRGRRRAQRKYPFDAVIAGAPHPDAAFGLRLMMRSTQRVQIRRLCPSTAFGMVVVERDPVVDLAFACWSAASRKGARLPSAQHRQPRRPVGFIPVGDIIEHLSRGGVGEHPVPELRGACDAAGHVRRQRMALDRTGPVVQPEQRSHGHRHHDRRLLPEDSRVIRAQDIHTEALGGVAIGDPGFQRGLRMRLCSDEEVEHQLPERPLVRHPQLAQIRQITHARLCGGVRARDGHALQLVLHDRAGSGLRLRMTRLDDGGGPLHAVHRETVRQMLDPHIPSRPRPCRQHRLGIELCEERRRVAQELAERVPRIQTGQEQIEGLQMRQRQMLESARESVEPVVPNTPAQHGPQ